MTNITAHGHFVNPFALKDGRQVHIDSVKRGLACECICLGCSAALEACKGEVKSHYFRHHSSVGSVCAWYGKSGIGETELHKIIKLGFRDLNFIQGLSFFKKVFEVCSDGRKLEKLIAFPFESSKVLKVEIEKTDGSFRPDVILTLENQRKLWIEITVTSAPSSEKQKYLADQKIDAIELRLTAKDILQWGSEGVKAWALNPTHFEWIYHGIASPLVAEAELELHSERARRDADFSKKIRDENQKNLEKKRAEDESNRKLQFEEDEKREILNAKPIINAAVRDGGILGNLNPEQLAAVTLPATHALILAGAGSGKTRVLTTRIAWLLQTNQVWPSGILAVTFTNKAAKEMLVRLSAMLPINVRGMWIGTFHGLCNRFLRAHYQLANLPQSFQILDTQDQLSAIKRLCKQFNIDDERFPPKDLMRFIAGCKEDGLRAKDIQTQDENSRKKVEIYALYEDQCQREGVVDFGELMLRSYELLRDNPAVREHYQRRFRHILIDEFQDTNKLQYAWIKLLAGQGEDAAQDTPGAQAMPGGSVVAVGDDDQSIYAFRGARVGNMADFVREFNVTHQIKLERNYRSFGNILDAANELISHNLKRLGKNLRTEAGPGEPVRVYQSASDFAEAQWFVDEVKQLVRDGTERKEIALLYRSNAQSRVMESALFNAGIPYRVYGGLRFFERAEIKHALAYLRLLENPHDDTSFMRVVNFPPRGIGARTIEQLQDVSRASGCSLHDGVSAVPGKAGANLSAFVAKLDVMREKTAGATLREIIELVLQHSGLEEHYKTEKEGQDRLENLAELVNAAEAFVSQEGFGRDAVALPVDELSGRLTFSLNQSPASQGLNLNAALRNEPLAELLAPNADTGETLSPLAAFLTHAALESGDNQAQAGQDAVQLMTVHSSKGLEFDCVFITGIEEGLFPHENAMNDAGGLEEERRLMYVAITRARKRLYLSHSQTRMLHGQTRFNLRSRFFDELPESALKWLTPKNQGFASGLGAGAGSGGWRGGAGSGAGRYGAGNSGAGNSGTGGARGDWGGGGFAARSGNAGSAERFASPPVPAQKAAPAHGLKTGTNVFHAKFGEGRVEMLEGTGDDARAKINFTRHGVKWLALSVAKLTVV